MKKLVGLFLVVGVVVMFALPAMSMPRGPERIGFSGQTMPKVDFPHEAHKGYVSDCKECHHMGVGTGSCDDCHGKDSRAPDTNRTYHKSCRGCHSERGVSGYRDCAFCHKR